MENHRTTIHQPDGGGALAVLGCEIERLLLYPRSRCWYKTAMSTAGGSRFCFSTRPKSRGKCDLVLGGFSGENSHLRSSKTGIQSNSASMKLKFLSRASRAPATPEANSEENWALFV